MTINRSSRWSSTLRCLARSPSGCDCKHCRETNRRAVGFDIKTAQYGWPVGMPLIRKVEPGLWEVRSHIKDGIARVLFTVEDHLMVLLHGFVKKSQKTPAPDLRIARQRLADLRKE